MKDAAIPYPKPSSPSDPQVLALFQGELARITAMPGLAAAGPALWPRFLGYYQDLARLPRKARRALQRQWRRSLGGLALLLALGQAPALAATINVGGACTLVDAITAANNNAPTGGCTAGSGADTIVVPASSIQTLTQVDNNAYGDNGLPVIRSVITIEGNGSTIARAGALLFRIFAVNGTGNLTLNETTVSGGAAGVGGGVFNGGTVTLTNSTMWGNYASRAGGGMFNGGLVTLTNSTVSGNIAPGEYGGGLYNSGTLTLTNATVSGNSAGIGGGVYNLGNATLMNSTVSGNRASVGGGVLNSFRSSSTLTVTNSTVSGNSASNSNNARGGGVWSGGTAILACSLVSGNSAGSGSEIYGFSSNAVIANNFNLFGHSGLTYAQAFSGFAPGSSDITATSDATPQALSSSRMR